MGPGSQLILLLLTLITLLQASSHLYLRENSQLNEFSSRPKNASFLLILEIIEVPINNLLNESDFVSFASLQQNMLANATRTLSQRRMMLLIQFVSKSQNAKQIYQFEQMLRSNLEKTHHFHSSYLIVAILIAPFLLFFTRDVRKATIPPQSKIQRISLCLFILCFLLKESHSAPCPQPNCLNNLNCPGNVCNVCKSEYYIVGSTCKYFTNMPGCSGANGTKCRSCQNGYYLSASYTCISCPSVIPYCLRCVGSPVLACNQCDFGNALNTTTYACDNCPYYLTDCVTCLTRYSCTTCVNQTLTVNAAGKCELCSVKKIGCYKCNSSVCLQCSNGYYLLPVSFCTPCNTTLPACVICPNSTVCTQCINNAFVLIGNSCITCGSIFPFCARCTPSMCRSCEQSFFLNVNIKCECMKGILIDNVCVDIAGCEGAMKYQNSSFCTKCNTDIFYYNTTTVTCDCKNGFLLNDQCSILYGCVAMYYINSTQACAMCNRTRHFSKNQTWCSCDVGYSLDQKDNSCFEICGDGILFSLQCDDGNNLDFDGCSRTCMIQRGFKCAGGSENSSSKCLNALENFELEVEEIQNMGEYDTGEFQFNIINFHPYFYMLNWTKIFRLDIQQNHNISSISIRGSRVVFIVDYYEDLEGMPATLYMNLVPENFQYPKTVNLTFSMISLTSPLILGSYPSAATLELLSLILLILSFLSLVILLISPCCHKMIAVETFTVLQLCNLVPYLVDSDSIVLRIFDNLSYVNGFGRQLFASATASEVYGETFEDMSLPKTFSQIMLINEGIIFAVVVIFILAHLLQKIIYRFKILKNQYQHFVNVYCCNLVFSVTMSLYLIFCVALTCNNHRVYEKNYKGRLYESTQRYKVINSSLNLSSVFFGQLLIVFVGFFNFIAFSVSQEFLQKSKNVIIQLLYKQVKRLNVKSKSYVMIYLANLFICFSLLAGLFFFDSKYKIFIYLLASIPYAVFVLIQRPYSTSTENFGICLGQITSLIFLVGLCVKQYFWLIKTPLSLYYQFYLSMAVISLLVAFVITAMVRFFVSCKSECSKVPVIIVKKKYSRYRKESDENQLVEVPKPNHLHLLDPLNLQDFTPTDNPDLLKLKDKLRNDLYEKRNMHKNVNPFQIISKPILETWLSDDGDQQ